MTRKIQFTKMQGVGNDFVLIDNISQNLVLEASLVRQIADRHFGIGCDQVLIAEPPSDPELDFTYRIFNSDGKEVAQCGNGARCFGRFVYERGLTDKTLLKVGTLSGPLSIDISDLSRIQVNMGQPRFDPRAIPLDLTAITALEKTARYRLTLPGLTRDVTVLSLGNPHCVISVPSVEEAPIAELGKALQNHPAFPAGVNVSFVQLLARNHIRCRVYERGAKETLACGSAACAAVIAGILQAELNPEVKVDLRGGVLTVNWRSEQPVFLIGPAILVFQGEFSLAKQ